MEKNKFDPSLEALTPEGVKFTFSPAGLPVRTLAYAIDKIIQWIILLIIIINQFFLQHFMGRWIIFLAYFLVEWFYYVICETAFSGQSLGKRMTGIRVIKNDGSPVDFSSSFVRNLLRFADTFLFFFPIALISISASGGFRRLGDWAGGTLVVYTQTSVRYPRNIAGLLAKYEPVIPPHPLSHEEKQAVLNFARRYPLLGESRANEIAGIYVPFLKNDETPDTQYAAYLMGIARSLSGDLIPEKEK
jgi:uncharacterized RDD family membrane protein YckC